MKRPYKFYVYILQDPRNPIPRHKVRSTPYNIKFEPFYVGKGGGNRADVHLHNAINNNHSHNPRLLERLKELHASKKELVITKVFESDDEEECYNKEFEAITSFGLYHKGGKLLNASSGKAGGWGGPNNPTFDRMSSGNHNFQVANPQLLNPKVIKLNKLLLNVTKPTDISKEDWVRKTGYFDLRGVKVGIMRAMSREDLPLKLQGNIVAPK